MPFRDDSLCHGNLGNWTALRPVATRTEAHEPLVPCLAESVIATANRSKAARRIRPGSPPTASRSPWHAHST